MVGNILENAYKWSDSIIRVHATQNSEDAEAIDIIIEDDGKVSPKRNSSKYLNAAYA